MAEGRETARLATPAGVAELQGIWDELREWTHGRIAAYVRDEAGDVYTKEERALGADSVRTGLRRGLDEESDDEDEAEDADDDDGDNEGEGDDGDKGRTQPPRGPGAGDAAVVSRHGETLRSLGTWNMSARGS